MWSDQVISMMIQGIWETIYMTVISTFAGYVIGLPMGIALTVTDKDGIRPNAAVYKVLDVISNLVRSIPFIILLVILIPFTRLEAENRRHRRVLSMRLTKSGKRTLLRWKTRLSICTETRNR